MKEIAWFVLWVFAFASSAAAGNDPKLLVNECITEVRSQFQNSSFDAFFNSADQSVQTNVSTTDQYPQYFVFETCMAKHGAPLGAAHPVDAARDR